MGVKTSILLSCNIEIIPWEKIIYSKEENAHEWYLFFKLGNVKFKLDLLVFIFLKLSLSLVFCSVIFKQKKTFEEKRILKKKRKRLWPELRKKSNQKQFPKQKQCENNIWEEKWYVLKEYSKISKH